jgi:hypothetical protein
MIDSKVAGCERKRGHVERNLTVHSTEARVSQPLMLGLALAAVRRARSIPALGVSKVE